MIVESLLYIQLLKTNVLIWIISLFYIYDWSSLKHTHSDTFNSEYVVPNCKYEHSLYSHLFIYNIFYYKYETHN
jgi:hypothetical protein